MEFWGVEVKSGQPFDVKLGKDRVLHLSQAALGELKKDKSNESICLQINIDGKKLVLGTLHSERLPQQLFDLVFDKEFQLSHNWKNGSVYFCGYIAEQPEEFEYPSCYFLVFFWIFNHFARIYFNIFHVLYENCCSLTGLLVGFVITDSDDFDSEEDVPFPVANGTQEVKKDEKPGPEKTKAGGKQKVKIVEPPKEIKSDGKDSDDDSDDSDDAMSEDSDSEEDNEDSSDDDDKDDEDSDEDEEEIPQKKQQSGKKRPSESATKTPSTDKKAKLVTPQKTDGKKGGVHVATPHPSKQAAKNANKSNQKSPASESAHSCTPCNRGFKTENALQAHNQVKHK